MKRMGWNGGKIKGKIFFFAAFLKWTGGSPIKSGGGRQGEGRGALVAAI
jgi:hypothetical protein